LFQCSSFIIIQSHFYLFQVLSDYLAYNAGRTGALRMRKAFCTSVMKAPFTFFMSENLGPIVQVFSRDLNIVSEDLIDAFHYAVLYVFATFSTVVRITMEVPLFLCISIPMFALCAMVLKQYFLKLKMCKTEFQNANDELFHAISDSIEGVKVIRTADGTIWAIDLLNEAFRNARIAVVASENCNMWLMRRIDPISVALSFATIIMATQLDTKDFPLLKQSLMNLTVAQSLSYIVFLQWALKAIGNAMYQMSSVERIHKYIKEIPSESDDGTDLDQLWPTAGEVEFKGLCLKYSPVLPLALDHVSFKLPHGAKVGVVGRTGSGKSTLLVALFRLIQPYEGDIKVNNRSIPGVKLSQLRKQMSIVPQVSSSNPMTFLPSGASQAQLL
jgi:ABC-type multidrug transport system fused ATPase/permease subunit